MKKFTSFILAIAVTASVSASLATSGTASDSPLVPRDSSPLLWDASLGYVKGIAADTSVADLAAYFDGALTVTDPAGNTVPADGAVGTDFVLSTDAGSSPALVYGDVNRDAKVNAKDISSMMKSAVGSASDANMTAFDANLDGATNLKDVAQVMKSVAGWQIDLGYVGWTLDLSPVEAAVEDPTIELYFTDSTRRDAPDMPYVTEDRSYVMHLAKNEAEGVNVNLLPMMNIDGLNAKLTPFTDKYGNTIETELLWEDFFFVKASQETVPDRLPPIQSDFSLKEMTYQPLFIKVRTTAESKPGLYRARFSLYDATGTEIKAANVYAEVWDFAVPAETHAKTAFGMGAYTIATGHPKYEGSLNELYAAYYDYMADNRLNPWCIPYDPIEDGADKWLDDPRVNTVLIAGGYSGDMYNNTSSQKIAQIYEKFKDHPEWLEKAIFYMVDEPLTAKAGTEGDIHEVINKEAMLNTVWKNARQIVPVPVIEEYDLGTEKGDTMTIVANHTTVLCPCSRLWPDSSVRVDGVTNHYPETSEQRYGMWADRFAGWKAEGKEVWWYAGNTPRSPMNNFDLENTGMEMRTLFWNQYHEDVDGFLYWAANMWGSTTSPVVFRLEGDEGLLVYCGYRYGIDGPVACYRGEIARDSAEDYEYLWLWEQKFGRESAMEWAEKIITNTYTFERDFANLEAVRIELGNALEEAYK